MDKSDESILNSQVPLPTTATIDIFVRVSNLPHGHESRRQKARPHGYKPV